MSGHKQRILVIDLGSSNCKSSLFRLDCTREDQAVAPIATYQAAPGFVEQDPEEWWSAVVRTVRELVARRESTASVAAIAVTGQMHAVVAVGEDGETLGRCATLADRRSIGEVNRIVEMLSIERIIELTGGRPGAFAPLAKIPWLRCNRPSVYSRTKVFLPPKDFIRYRLTGEAATDPIDAAGTLLFDIRKRAWAPALLEATGLEPSKLPPVRAPTEIAGHLVASAATQLNLKSGIPIAVGAGDDIESLGAGVTEPGMSLEHLGSTGSIMACVERIVHDRSLTLDIYPSIQPDRWFIGGSTSNAGLVLAWGQKLLHGGTVPPEVWSHLLAAWSPNAVQPLVTLPYLHGERAPVWDPQAVGIVFGLTTQHTRDDVLRSIFEGVAFALRHILEAVEDAGVPVNAIATTDASDHDWTRIRASIYNKTVMVVTVEDPTALGSMLLAGASIGAFEDLSLAAREFLATPKVIEPVEEFVDPFSRLYETYKEIYLRNRSLFGRASADLA